MVESAAAGYITAGAAGRLWSGTAGCVARRDRVHALSFFGRVYAFASSDSFFATTGCVARMGVDIAGRDTGFVPMVESAVSSALTGTSFSRTMAARSGLLRA